MIKLPALLLPFALLYGDQTLFLMPDEQSRFTHHLTHALKERPAPILIITPSFRHSEVKKALLQEARKGSRITLIAQNLSGDPLSIAQYENTDLYTYTARLLHASIILIGNRHVCTFPGGVDEESLRERVSIIRCSDDPAEVAAYRTALVPLLGRARQYLK